MLADCKQEANNLTAKSIIALAALIVVKGYASNPYNHFGAMNKKISVGLPLTTGLLRFKPIKQLRLFMILDPKSHYKETSAYAEAMLIKIKSIKMALRVLIFEIICFRAYVILNNMS